MTEERFEDLFNEQKVSAPKLKPGDRIEAIIAGISGDNIFLDIGSKSEGVLAASELADEEGNITVRPGDAIKVYFLSDRGGALVFTAKVGSGQTTLQELEDAYASGIPVQGRVVAEIKGGFQVMVAGQRGFCPYSQIDIRRNENPEEYLEQQLPFKIIEFSGKGRNIILSARAVMEEAREQERQALIESLEVGAKVSGTVSSIRDFGAFVDIGGVDGLIPVSELAWGQVDRVDDVLSRGQKVEVIIRKLDWDNDRISLSLKDTLENPWDKVMEKYPVGAVLTGKVSRLTKFGAFITLEPGVDGLLHISKLGAGRKINHPREAIEEGQAITVRIDSIDREKQRISLVPEDYQDESASEEEMEQTYVPPKESRSMGTFADLLAARAKGKKS